MFTVVKLVLENGFSSVWFRVLRLGIISEICWLACRFLFFVEFVFFSLFGFFFGNLEGLDLFFGVIEGVSGLILFF